MNIKVLDLDTIKITLCKGDKMRIGFLVRDRHNNTIKISDIVIPKQKSDSISTTVPLQDQA